jgi:hypothetical protein
MNVQEKLAKIQTEFKAKKSRFNSFGKYNFRSAEDILEAIKPFLMELKVIVTVSEELVPSDYPFPIMKSKATLQDAESGESVSAYAIVAIDLDQKGMQMPQKFGSASSYGKKYALGNLLLIDDTADADATNDHGKSSTRTQKAKPELKGEALKKAKAAIKAGAFTVADIEKKYTIPTATLKTLK